MIQSSGSRVQSYYIIYNLAKGYTSNLNESFMKRVTKDGKSFMLPLKSKLFSYEKRNETEYLVKPLAK